MGCVLEHKTMGDKGFWLLADLLLFQQGPVAGNSLAVTIF
jgi:hypothetical protein